MQRICCWLPDNQLTHEMYTPTVCQWEPKSTKCHSSRLIDTLGMLKKERTMPELTLCKGAKETKRGAVMLADSQKGPAAACSSRQ